jgi:serine/threonine-protein kinase
MERLRGQDLRKVLLESDALVPERVVRLAIDASLGLQAVHDAGLVHRDLKPENLFVTLENEDSERCKVLDFGIAKAVGTGTTKPHSLLGTLKYMAPEQVADPGGVGPATDIYALGAIVYECLAGRPPHVAETEPELMFNIMNVEPPALATLVPTLDPALCSIVARTLERDPERRYASAVALAGALSSCLVAYGEEEQTHNAGAHARDRRRRWIFAGIAASIPVGLALGWGYGPSSVGSRTSAVPSIRPRSEPLAPATPCIVASVASASRPDPEPASAAPSAIAPRKGLVHPAPRSARPSVLPLDQNNPYE